MDSKYIELLIKKCTNLENVKSLFISYSKEISPFIDLLVKRVRELGVDDIYLECEDKYKIHDELKNMTYSDMKDSPYFNKAI